MKKHSLRWVRPLLRKKWVCLSQPFDTCHPLLWAPLLFPWIFNCYCVYRDRVAPLSPPCGSAPSICSCHHLSWAWGAQVQALHSLSGLSELVRAGFGAPGQEECPWHSTLYFTSSNCLKTFLWIIAQNAWAWLGSGEGLFQVTHSWLLIVPSHSGERAREL
jgi:hypothetical protein